MLFRKADYSATNRNRVPFGDSRGPSLEEGPPPSLWECVQPSLEVTMLNVSRVLPAIRARPATATRVFFGVYSMKGTTTSRSNVENTNWPKCVGRGRFPKLSANLALCYRLGDRNTLLDGGREDANPSAHLQASTGLHSRRMAEVNGRGFYLHSQGIDGRIFAVKSLLVIGTRERSYPAGQRDF
jgi:hypothetical protein